MKANFQMRKTQNMNFRDFSKSALGQNQYIVAENLLSPGASMSQ